MRLPKVSNIESEAKAKYIGELVRKSVIRVVENIGVFLLSFIKIQYDKQHTPIKAITLLINAL